MQKVIFSSKRKDAREIHSIPICLRLKYLSHSSSLNFENEDRVRNNKRRNLTTAEHSLGDLTEGHPVWENYADVDLQWRQFALIEMTIFVFAVTCLRNQFLFCLSDERLVSPRRNIDIGVACIRVSWSTRQLILFSLC